MNESNADDRNGLLNNDPDYICLKKFDYSLKKLLVRYPDGAPEKVVADALGITEAEVERCYQHIVAALKKSVRPLPKGRS